MLMMSSYVLNWTRIGNTILCTMDLVDITLPVRFLLLPFLLLRSQSPTRVWRPESLLSACIFGSRGPGGAKLTRPALRPPAPPKQLAKLFKYTGWHQASDVTFAVFFVLWILTRHVIFGRIIYSIVYESSQVLEYRWSSDEGYFWSRRTYYGFVALLVALQLIICLWFAMSASFLLFFRTLRGLFPPPPPRPGLL